MGNAEVNSAVADSGPLIHLAEIGCLPLLRVFNTLHIPDTVGEETVALGRVRHDDILALGIVQQYSVSAAQLSEFVRHNTETSA